MIKLCEDHAQLCEVLVCFGTCVPTCSQVSKLKDTLPVPLLGQVMTDMNINIHVDINMNIDITTPPPPPLSPPCAGRDSAGRAGGGMGWDSG